MLLLLMPEQVSRYWEDIKEGLERALPLGPPDRTQRILTGLLAGYVQCWISYQRTEGEAIVDGAALTKIKDDEIFGVRDLELFCVWAIEKTHESTWTEGIEALLTFGRGKGCNRLTGWTDVAFLKDVIKDAGGETRYTFLTVPI